MHLTPLHSKFLAALAFSALPLSSVKAAPSTFLPSPGFLDVSTLASNGDNNPYGVAFVPKGFPSGPLNPGDILVSNFNSSSGVQGTGTTIVAVPANGVAGNVFTFFSIPFNAPTDGGFTTALGVLKRGFVVVGNLPNTPLPDGTPQPQSGSLLFIDSTGKNIVLRYTNAIDANVNGPWDLTIDDGGNTATIFFSNVLSGTVVRLGVTVGTTSVAVTSSVEIANGYTTAPSVPALVLGPTGLAYDKSTDTLYVASTADNAIYKIPNAESRSLPVVKGTLVTSDSTHLHGPLALVLAPNGNLLTANGDAVNPPTPAGPELFSEIAEFTKQGKFLGSLSVDPNNGAAFGIAVDAPSGNNSARFAAVNDDDNSVDVLNLSF